MQSNGLNRIESLSTANDFDLPDILPFHASIPSRSSSYNNNSSDSPHSNDSLKFVPVSFFLHVNAIIFKYTLRNRFNY